MNRVLVIGETPHMGTVFGTLIRELCHRLTLDEKSVACLGFNYTGWPSNGELINYPLYPWIGPPHKPENIDAILNEYKPDTLLFLGPPFFFNWYKKNKKYSKYKVILHTSLKSMPINKYMKSIYKKSDIIVVNSHFEEECLQSELNGQEISYIPPAINTKHFKISGITPQDNRFKVGCVIKDTPQIDIPTLLKAFGIVSKADGSIVLGIFSDISQLNQWKINDMLDVYEIKDRCTVMKPQPEINFGFPSMGHLYGSMDLLVLPHQDLSLNISVIEGAYCNIPMIIPHGGSSEEFAPKSACYLNKTDTYVAPPLNTFYKVFDAEELADAIIVKFMEKKEKKRKYCLSMEKFDWSLVLKEWKKLLF